VFYASWLRNREQYEAFVNSRAFRKLAELPFAAELKKAWKDGFQEGIDAAKAAAGDDENAKEFFEWTQKPENKELLAFLGELFSDEVFLVGDASFLEVSQKLVKSSQELQELQAEAGGDFENLTDEQIAKIEKFVADLALPNMLFGFKVRDPARADRQLKRLEAALKEGIPIAGNAEAAEADEDDKKADDGAKPKVVKIETLRRVPLNGGDFIQIPLDGSMIPWDQIPMDEANDQQKKLLERIKPLLVKKTVTFNLGLWKDYVLFSFGADSRQIESLGKGKLLFDHPQLAALRKFADRKITGVGFVSDEFMKAAGQQPEGTGPFAQYGRQIGAMKEIPEKLRERLKADLVKFDVELAGFLPKPGGSLSFEFLTDRGHESYAYDWSLNRVFDASRKLSLVQHVGGKPIFAAVARGQSTLEEYKLLAKLVARTEEYLTEFLAPELDAEQRAKFDTIVQKAKPLAERFHNATVEMLYPSLADGQSGFVLDGSMAIDPQSVGQPAAEKPLHVVLPNIVLGVSDSALLLKAFSEYASIIDDAAAVLHEEYPDNVREFKLPRPESRKSDEGEYYFYNIPFVSAVLPELTPTAGFSKTVASFSLSSKQAESYLTPVAPEFDGPAAKLDRPLAMVSSFNFASLVDLATPWISYGADRVLETLPEDDPAEDKEKDEENAAPKQLTRKGVEQFVTQSKVVIEVLKCVRGASSVVYQEGKTLVRHTEWHYTDLPE